MPDDSGLQIVELETEVSGGAEAPISPAALHHAQAENQATIANEQERYQSELQAFERQQKAAKQAEQKSPLLGVFGEV